jgi:hypothetical protein
MRDDACTKPNAPAEMEPGRSVNNLYAQWKNVPEDTREPILCKFDPHLTQYAECVVWMQHVTGQVFSHLALYLPQIQLHATLTQEARHICSYIVDRSNAHIHSNVATAHRPCLKGGSSDA